MNKKKNGGYLRFLNSWIPSIVVTYWKPVSIRCVASFAVVVPATMFSFGVEGLELHRDTVNLGWCAGRNPTLG